MKNAYFDQKISNHGKGSNKNECPTHHTNRRTFLRHHQFKRSIRCTSGKKANSHHSKNEFNFQRPPGHQNPNSRTWILTSRIHRMALFHARDYSYIHSVIGLVKNPRQEEAKTGQTTKSWVQTLNVQVELKIILILAFHF